MMQFYNTLTKRKENFIPINKGEVKMYTCGPTVYDYAHIGNFRAYIFEDLLRRYLKYKGFKVTQIMNITDIDDKTIRRSNEEGISLKEYTERYTNFFFEDLDSLGIERAECYPRATDHIPEMVDMIEQLLKKGYAYRLGDSIYFDIGKFPDYGKLSKIDINNVRSGTRYDTDEYEKGDVRDFVLWKEEKGGVAFEARIGRGRPGWHIECSAMSTKYLGSPFDIHTGGVDNIFPHHENEIAQSEAAIGNKFVNYWLHCAHLFIKKDKMSKSLGNIVKPRELIERGFDLKSVRYLLISIHYRDPLNYDDDEIKRCTKTLERLNNFISLAQNYSLFKDGGTFVLEKLENAKEEFEKSMDDDLNISGGLGAIFTLIRDLSGYINERGLSADEKCKIINFFKRIDSVLNVMKFGSTVDEKISHLIRERDEARRIKDFARADKIRDELLALGIIIEDTKNGTHIKVTGQL